MHDPEPVFAEPWEAHAFALAVNPLNGEVFVAQYLSLNHPTGGTSYDETIHLASLSLHVEPCEQARVMSIGLLREDELLDVATQRLGRRPHSELGGGIGDRHRGRLAVGDRADADDRAPAAGRHPGQYRLDAVEHAQPADPEL